MKWRSLLKEILAHKYIIAQEKKWQENEDNKIKSLNIVKKKKKTDDLTTGIFFFFSNIRQMTAK